MVFLAIDSGLSHQSQVVTPLHSISILIKRNGGCAIREQEDNDVIYIGRIFEHEYKFEFVDLMRLVIPCHETPVEDLY